MQNMLGKIIFHILLHREMYNFHIE